MRTIIFVIFGFLLFGGSIFPAMGQTPVFADHVVINEVDINPPGDDSKSISEWVELHNPTNLPVDIGGWSIASSTVLKKSMTIPVGTIMPPNSFLVFSHTKVWFTDVSEVVKLSDTDGTVVDQTPSISDLAGDFKSWQRIYDGLDTDTQSDWEFSQSSAGSTNGKYIAEIESQKTTLTVSVDKPNYLFNENAIISGAVSEQLFIEKPFFQAEKINIRITGPNAYENNISLYPDLNLQYKTTLSLQKVLGINAGTYHVNVQYGDATDSTQFTVGEELIVTEEIQESELTLSTNKESYIPGELVTITATTNEIIPFEGLKFKVTDPNGKQTFDGTLYPDSTGKFSTTIYMTTVNPEYGFHQITADYSTHSALTSFELSEDAKEDKPISLNTDKQAYGLGESVVITGRLNNLWIFSLDLEILQTGLGSLDTDVQKRTKVLDSVRLAGDSTFRYEFKIGNNPDRYGEYKVTVSKDVGTASLVFHVVENPEEFEASSIPFTVTTDKTTYDVGEPIIVSGKINDPISSSTFQTATVDIAIKPLDGSAIFSANAKPSSTEPSKVLYSLTAIPDQAGNYKVKDTLYKAIYGVGDYLLRATYADGLLSDTTTFSIVDPLAIEGIDASLDKTIYGLGEKVQLSGIIPTGGAGKADVQITLTKPDGDTNKYGTTIDKGRFSWSWTIPSQEKQQTVLNERVKTSSNYGIYKISVAQSDSAPAIFFFKVSPNPEEDVLNIVPLTVTTEKPVYQAGEKLKVLGTAITRVQGTEGLVVPDRVDISVKTPLNKVIHSSSVFFDQGGNFESTFEMPISVFTEGTYKVTATYQNKRAENFFQVTNDIIRSGSDTLSLVIGTDKEQYNPGDVAFITARPTKFIFVETIKVGVPSEEQTKINCGSFVCGIGVVPSVLRPDPTGTFVYEHKFPNNAKLGTYVVTFSTEFGTFTKPVQLVEKLPEPEVQTSLGERVIEKVNRLTESEIQINVNSKTEDEKELVPRVIQGSMFTPARGEEANVNIKVSAEDGTCIIGTDSACMVTESTRVPGAIYKVVQIDGIDYNVRYSGPDVRLEKFTILPVDSNTVFPDSTWNVEVIKEEQSSRLYYKVTYITLE